MKRIIMMCIILGVSMIITPLISVRYERVEEKESFNETSVADNKVIRVMSSDNGFIKEIDIREYLVGCVSGEVGASAHHEALKAQAVASYTYAKYVSSRDSKKLGGADISDDSSVYQSYIDKAKRKEKWGDSFDKNEKTVTSAVDEVMYQYLSFDGEAALTAYHNICSGVTESAENVWGESYPYLVSVVSSGDRLSPDFISVSKITVDDFKDTLQKSNINFSNEVSVKKRYDSGYVKSLLIGATEISGSDFRKLFSLKSADFDIEMNDKSVTITCRGNGHFVGMSQYGADYMARQGATYSEILNHYYPGTQLVKLKN